MSESQHHWSGNKNPRWSRDNRITLGQKFGSWTTLSDKPFTLYGALYVMCRCKCGVEKEVNVVMMEKGRSTQCKSCATTERHHKNGKLIVDTLDKKLLQKRVSSMKNRCNNPNDQSYSNYGGRGIEFRFASIKDGVDYLLATFPMTTYVGYDIDRIDNDGHYEPGNLRFVTRKQNQANKRTVSDLQATVDMQNTKIAYLEKRIAELTTTP